MLGDLILVLKNERIPADLLLLSTDNPEGTGFLETSTLDGEKHLKPRYCPKETLNCLDHSTVDPEVVKIGKIMLENSKAKKSNQNLMSSTLEKELTIPVDLQATF